MSSPKLQVFLALSLNLLNNVCKASKKMTISFYLHFFAKT